MVDWRSALLVVAVVAAGCGGKATEPPVRGPFELTVVRGDNQPGEVGMALLTPVVVRVRDRLGAAPAIALSVTVATGGGSIASPSATTNASGEATINWTLGTQAGPQRLLVSAAGSGALPIDAVAIAGPVASFDTASAGFQYTVVGRAVSDRPTVRVSDHFGNPVPGVEVTFTRGQQGGAVTDPIGVTTQAGLVRIGSWKIANETGPQFLVAKIEGIPSIQFESFGTPASLRLIGPRDRSANVGTEVSPTPAVLAVDDDGESLSGADITFAVRRGGGTLSGPVGKTGIDGAFQAGQWILGLAPGPNQLEATAVGLPTGVLFTAEGVDASPGVIDIAAGGGSQAGFFGNFVAVPPSVRVTDARGNPVAGRTVTFSLVAGDGSITRSTPVLDAHGIATLGSWRLGTAATQEVRAAVTGLPPVAFRVAASAPPTSKFAIELRFLSGNLPPSREAAIQAAVNRWSSLIVGDQPDVPIAFGADPAGCYPALHETVDDMVIFVRVEQIDGPGRTLGAAGPCLARDENLLPVVGIMILDLADLDLLDANHTLADVLVHETGHVLGFGETIWRLKGLLDDADRDNPVFRGPSAMGAFGGLAPVEVTSLLVPLENTGGIGTRVSHWRESVFKSELMTGFIDSSNPLSAVTAGAMRDLGYQVDDRAADPYDFAQALGAVRSAGTRPAHTVRWPGALRTVDRAGRIRQVFR